MAIEVLCRCGKRLILKDEAAGKRLKCPTCQFVIQVPAGGMVAPSDGYQLADQPAVSAATGSKTGSAPRHKARPEVSATRRAADRHESERASGATVHLGEILSVLIHSDVLTVSGQLTGMIIINSVAVAFGFAAGLWPFWSPLLWRTDSLAALLWLVLFVLFCSIPLLIRSAIVSWNARIVIVSFIWAAATIGICSHVGLVAISKASTVPQLLSAMLWLILLALTPILRIVAMLVGTIFRTVEAFESGSMSVDLADTSIIDLLYWLFIALMTIVVSIVGSLVVGTWSAGLLLTNTPLAAVGVLLLLTLLEVFVVLYSYTAIAMCGAHRIFNPLKVTYAVFMTLPTGIVVLIVAAAHWLVIVLLNWAAILIVTSFLSASRSTGWLIAILAVLVVLLPIAPVHAQLSHAAMFGLILRKYRTRLLPIL